MRTAVFGYGSLVDAASASRTLGRPVERVWPARLTGHRRRFSQARDNLRSEKTFARADDGSIPRWILGMNLERAEGEPAPPNGALIEITDDELARLDVREIRYDRVEVGELVEAATAPGFDSVVTYVAKPANLAAEPPPGAVILRSYAEAVEAAFAGLGPGELREYRRTTLPYPVELVDGELVHDEIPEGNPREW